MRFRKVITFARAATSAVLLWATGHPTLSASPASSSSSDSFPTQILPILTHAGCNAGACHGAATGQGGFKLSLLGYDPVADHAHITREFGGRRIDPAFPGESLLLAKPTLKIDHEGGRRIRTDSEAYRLLLEWIADGAPYGPEDLRVEAVAVRPTERWLTKADESYPLEVTATFSDGSHRDVTALALYTSNDDAVAGVTRAGIVTARGQGLTSIMVRFGGQVAAARVAVPYSNPDENPVANERHAPDPAADSVLVGYPGGNFIDDHVAALWRRLGLKPAALSTDAEFLRRIHLDLTGRLPSSDEVREFLRGPSTPGRRVEVIDRLLAGEAFVDFWTLKLADLLLLGGRRGSEAETKTYHAWLRRQVAEGIPWDQTVRSLVMAEGDLKTSGPANFLTLASDPRDLAEHVGSIFLGTQIACARCHTHPSDRWTRDDYHRFAAYFARIDRTDGAVRISPRGEVDDPSTGRPVDPKPLGSAASAGTNPADTEDRRTALAAWMTAPDNPFLARAFVNRVWQAMLGRGLVEPVDDLRPTNPPTHPELLEALARDFIANGWDLRHLVRQVATSRTYQLSSRNPERHPADDRFYTRALPKPLVGQVFVDAVAQVTGVPDSWEGYPSGTRSVQLVDAQLDSYALDVLGRCARVRKCDPASGGNGGGLARALHLINGTTINAKLAGGIMKELVDQRVSPTGIVEELYLRALGRYPEPEALHRWCEFLAAADEDADRAADSGTGTQPRAETLERIQDLLWSLLNSREFALNH